MHRAESSVKKAEATPPVKVVGFHVEGASPSPRNTLLAETLNHASSLSPVIIPPAFQGANQRGPGDISPHQVMAAAVGMFGTGPEGAAGATIAAAAPHPASSGLRPLRTASEADVPSMPTTPNHVPAALPLTPVASAPSVPPGTLPSSSPFQLAANHLPKPPATTAAPPVSERRALAFDPAPVAAQGERAAARPPPAPPAPAAEGAARGAPRQKEMTKAERRALQEAQRAAKAASKAGGQSGGPSAAAGAAAPHPPAGPSARMAKQGSRENLLAAERSRERVPGGAREAEEKGGRGGGGGARGGGAAGSAAAAAGPASASPEAGAAGVAPPVARSTELFAHLPRHRTVSVDSIVARGATASLPLPAIRLGLALAEGRVRGANARCIALLDVFRQVVTDFRPENGRELARELQPLLNTVIAFLVQCRPLCISMGSAIKHVKAALEKMKLDASLGEAEARDHLLTLISSFVQEKVLFAGDVLAGKAAERLRDDDVVLTYGYSSVVAAVLLRAAAAGRRFSVVVVDARPLLEGRRMLRTLLAAAVPTQYVSLNGLGFALPRVTKVLLGAGGVLSNGAVLARVGTAVVAMAAAAAHVPVLVACETYKFHERVQLDSITHNELGDPELLVQVPGGGPQWLSGWSEQEGLGLLSLMYDTMPAQFVSMVITEVGAIPPTSVPVILREYRADGNVA